MAYELDETELAVIRGLLRANPKTDLQDLKLVMIRLAHDGSDQSMDILRETRGRIPAALRDFFECAWDECSYFNFIGKVNEVCLTPDEAPALTAEPETDAMREELRRAERELSEHGVVMNLVPGAPLAIRLAYVRLILERIGELRYRGRGFVHFYGCAGDCGRCIQRTWCEVAVGKIAE